jgi:diguanylate cyclase (GGDEF)-like protein
MHLCLADLLSQRKIKMANIIKRCLEIDSKALQIYEQLSNNAKTGELTAFWKAFALDLECHIRFWENLLTSADKGVFSGVFEKPDNVLEELEGIYEKVSELTIRSQSVCEAGDAFPIAFKLEFYLMHPAFETLFQYLKTLSDEKTPGEDYDAHVNRLFEALTKHNLVTIELELLGETLHRLWQENKKMAIQNSYDALTGVLNRRGLFNAIKHLAHLAHRNKNNVGIMMIDIDRFKKINDTFGHQFGDQVLRYVAETIRNNVRASDVLGRYGGEEFLVFLSSIDPDALYGVGEKMRLAVENGNKEMGRVTISIGLAQDLIVKEVDKKLSDLIRKADEKLFEAKRTGRNRVVV